MYKNSICGYIFTSIVFSSLAPVISASENVTYNVNILVFLEDKHASSSIDAVVSYVNHTPSLGMTIGKVYKIALNATDRTKAVINLCTNIDEVFGGSDLPDIAVDFTKGGVPSETVKLISKVLNFPTISGSLGQEGEIQNWRELMTNMKEYLIHIVPPVTMVPYAVRSIAAFQNLKDLVLLYDEDYHISPKLQSLLHELPDVRAKTLKLDIRVAGVKQQFKTILNENYTNIFIASTSVQISDLVAYGQTVARHPIRWYSLTMDLTDAISCIKCFDSVSVVHLRPRRNLRHFFHANSFDNSKFMYIFRKARCYPTLMDAFYFDLTLAAVSAVKKMKQDGSWVAPPRRVCKDTEEFSDDYMLPLFENFQSEEIHQNNILRPFHMDSEKITGKSYSQFDLQINRFDFHFAFVRNWSQPGLNVDLRGTWTSGFLGKELIATYTNSTDLQDGGIQQANFNEGLNDGSNKTD